jgi:trypsin-like peptidase
MVLLRLVPRSIPILLVLALGVAPAWSQIEIGRHETVRIESALNYHGVTRGATQLVWSEVITRPGASYLAIHFSRFELASGDVLMLTDAKGGQGYRLEGHGKGEGTFWARHVDGDTVRLELHAKNRSGGPGFVIDEIAVGDSIGRSTESTEAICGLSDLRNAACFKDSYPAQYGQARAVARLLINGSRLCTGWLVSPYNHLLTNAHCIDTPMAALNTDFDFGGEAPNCSDVNCQLCFPGQVFSGSSLVRLSTSLDYALVRIDTGDPQAQFGHLEIDPAGASVGQQIFIPQHPGGRAKEFGLFSSDPYDNGICRVSSLAAAPCFGTGYNDVGYSCDTEPGSSGSPVLSMATGTVVALHHCSACPNRAVPIQLVYGEIHGDLVGGCQTDADCDDGRYCTGPDSCVNGNCQRGTLPCLGQRCDEDTDTCSPLCNDDGICDSGENCGICPRDCISGTTYRSVCGNGVCEIGGGETCLSCPDDCNTAGSLCCGLTTDCSNSACSSGGKTCTRGSTNVIQYCCGDGFCAGDENFANCGVDCPPAYCGNGICDPGEDCRSCSADCKGKLTGKPSSRFCCGNQTRERAESPTTCNGNF